MTKYFYSAKVVKIVDGDTIDAMIDVGFDIWIKKRVRYMGLDTWESRTRDKAEKVKGLAAKARNKELLKSNNNYFLIQSHGLDKYGRLLGEIFIGSEDNPISVNETLIQEGHAYVYDGGTKKVFGS